MNISRPTIVLPAFLFCCAMQSSSEPSAFSTNTENAENNVINRKDVLHVEDIGVFFTKPQVADDIVYYIPFPQTVVTKTPRQVELWGSLHDLWLATLSFPRRVDLDRVRKIKPEWASVGFVRADVFATKPCSIAVPKSDDFPYRYKIDKVWKRSGRVSTNEAIYCQLKVALPRDSQSGEKELVRLASEGSLIDPGYQSEIDFPNDDSESTSGSDTLDSDETTTGADHETGTSTGDDSGSVRNIDLEPLLASLSRLVGTDAIAPRLGYVYLGYGIAQLPEADRNVIFQSKSGALIKSLFRQLFVSHAGRIRLKPDPSPTLDIP